MAAVFSSSSSPPLPSLPSSSSSSSTSFSFVPYSSPMPNPNSLEEALYECLKSWENPSNSRSFPVNVGASTIPISDMRVLSPASIRTTEMAYTTETQLSIDPAIASCAMDSYPSRLPSSASSSSSSERKLVSSSVNGVNTANISAMARPLSSPRTHQIQKGRSRRTSSKRVPEFKTIFADQSNFVAMVKQYTGMEPTVLTSLLNSPSPLGSSSCSASSLAAVPDSDFLWDYPIPNSSPVNPSYQSYFITD